MTKKKRNASRKHSRAMKAPNPSHPVGRQYLINQHGFSTDFATAIAKFAQEKDINLAFSKKWAAGEDLKNWVERGGSEQTYDLARKLTDDGKFESGFQHGKEAVFLGGTV